MNSRMKFIAIVEEEDKPSNTSKGKGLILETPYKPGFVEDKDLESVKMAIDKELSDISNAFYKTTEKTADTIKRVDEIKIEGDGLLAKIEEVDFVSKEGDIALAERITKLEAEVGDGVKALIEEEARVRASEDGALAERITTLTASSEAGDAVLTQNMTVVSDKVGKIEAKWGVQTNVNGKISGIQLNNDGAESSFEVVADRFTISDGTSSTIPPFEVVGGHTRIKSAFINTMQSDNWDGTNGWAITREGNSFFRSGEFRGDIRAESGYFKGDITGASGTFSGNLNVTDTSGNVGMKISNSQILIYDEHGRLRVKLGNLS